MSVSTCLALQDSSVAALSNSVSTTVLAAATYGVRNFLMLSNPSAVTIWINLSGGTAAANGLGSFALTAGSTIKFSVFVPTNAITAIAASTTPTFTVQYA